MRKISLVLLCLAGLVLNGCIFLTLEPKPKKPMEITTSLDDKLSNNNSIEIKTINNLLHEDCLYCSKHSDLPDGIVRGLYINPVLIKNNNASVLFLDTSYFSVFSYGKYLGFMPIKLIVFLIDGEIIVEVPFSSTGIKDYGETFEHYGYAYVETARGEVSINDFQKLANAKKLVVIVIGNREQKIYDNIYSSIEDNFIQNLKTFYERIKDL